MNSVNLPAAKLGERLYVIIKFQEEIFESMHRI